MNFSPVDEDIAYLHKVLNRWSTWEIARQCLDRVQAYVTELEDQVTELQMREVQIEEES